MRLLAQAAETLLDRIRVDALLMRCCSARLDLPKEPLEREAGLLR